MVAVVFLALPILAVVNLAFWLVMRIRLMRMDSARDSDDVLGTYAALFPNSVLPRCVSVCILDAYSVRGCHPVRDDDAESIWQVNS